ncbi:MAG: response regulator [Candidatus Cloacimonetes bacterium]|nr:response regulator [Candidatus Cloacimonadota bacterium]
MRQERVKQPTPFVILVIEDDRSFQSLVREVAEKSGATCAVVSSGAECLARIEAVQPSLLLVDYMLGDTTAPELVRKLRGLGHEQPFVAMTGYGSEEIAVEIMKQGALDYINKDDIFLDRLSIVLKSAREKLRIEQELAAAQLALEQQKNYYQSFIDHSLDIIILLDNQGRIRQTNPAFPRETGFSDADFNGLYLKEMLDGDSHARFDAMLQAARRGQTPEPCEMLLLDFNQALLPIDAVLIPLPADDGRESELLFMGRVLSERKKLEEQLRQSQKMQAIGRLAGGIAHDFNNILTTIIGFSELIAHSVPEDSEVFEYINEVRGASRRATSITNQLLMFSRRQVLQPRVLHLNRFIHEMRRMLDRLLLEDIALKLELASELMAVKVDHGQLSQVLLNLAVNARDAMQDGGTLLIQTRNVLSGQVPRLSIESQRIEWYVCLTMTDTGTGMEPEVCKQIFEPFFTTKPEGKGTGLGMAVVYGIVSQHNGVIDIESELGVGTSVHVYLPAVYREKRRASNEEETPRTMLQGKGRKVLIVEDEPHVLLIARKILSRNNYQVIEATSRHETETILGNDDGGIDLAFIDVVLRDGNGLELARHIRKHHSKIHVLLTSGYTGDKAQFKSISEEGFPFLQKPFSAIELLQAVADAL